MSYTTIQKLEFLCKASAAGVLPLQHIDYFPLLIVPHLLLFNNYRELCSPAPKSKTKTKS
jgi:hypothetical protein